MTPEARLELARSIFTEFSHFHRRAQRFNAYEASIPGLDLEQSLGSPLTGVGANRNAATQGTRRFAVRLMFALMC